MKLTEGGRLERPNICWICKRTPPIGSVVVDTEKHFEGYPFELNGRLYVCETCATQIAGFFDLVDKNQVEIAHTAQARAEAVVRGVKLRVDQLVKDLSTLALDPSVFMEAEDGSSREESADGDRAPENSPSQENSPSEGIEGDQSGVSGEAGSEGRAVGAKRGADSKPSGGRKSAATAQPRPRNRANTAA